MSSYDKALNKAGYRPSSSDPQKIVNPTTGHWVKEHDGGRLTFSTSRHNHYGSGMSQKDFADRLKK